MRKDEQANRRRHARLAAVQALYQAELGGENEVVVMGEFRRHRLGRDVEGIKLDADDAFFQSLVEGVARRRPQLDEMIAGAMTTGRSVARLEVILRQILRLGALELLTRGDVPARTAITEYVDITADFFGDKETSVVNGILDRLARIVRPEEMEGAAPAGGSDPT